MKTDCEIKDFGRESFYENFYGSIFDKENEAYLTKNNKINSQQQNKNNFTEENLKITKENEINCIIKNENDRKNKDSINKNHLGRKKLGSHQIGKHNKYSEDNVIRKIKSLLLSYILNFVNNYIKKVYNGNIGKGIFEKKLKKISQLQVLDSKKDKDFLSRNLKDIFSDKISGKYSCYSLDHNEKVIDALLNEENLEKRKQIEILFSFTFSNLLNYIIGKEIIPELAGLEKLEQICHKFENDQEYYHLIKHYIINFEDIIMRKKIRNS